MIILEGPDNAGKTTLGLKLETALGVTLIHSQRPPADSDDNDLLSHAVAQLEPRKVIMDRNYLISELVYGTILRGQPGLGRERHLKLMNDMLDLKHILIIYCRPSADVILDNGNRQQMEGVINQHAKIISNYDRLMGQLGILKGNLMVRYNYEQDNFKHLAITCHHHLKLQYGEDNYES